MSKLETVVRFGPILHKMTDFTASNPLFGGWHTITGPLLGCGGLGVVWVEGLPG